MTIEPGTQIGQYLVKSLLGEGGMGAVYYAEHVILGRPAAIKVLLPHIARNTGLVQRFINEGRIAAAMKHRNVVDVLDCGQFPSADAPNAQWYIVLEFLHGMSLAKFIADRRGQPADFPTILHILGEACNGLHAAHQKHNLVHRDVKPDNLYLTQTEDDPMRVKILDFGIAKLRQPGVGVQTLSQTAMGTPAYAAPEQLRESKEVDRTADVWALGVIAFEMATGTRPWGDTVSIYQIIAHHTAMKKPPDPRAVRPDLPKKWAAAVSKAMEPDPRRRWPTPRDLARALAEATPMPYSENGMSILEKFAKELTVASSHSLTVGRPLPPEVRLDPAEVATAKERPLAAAKPATVSDGVPRLPGAAATPVLHPEAGQAPSGSPAHPISTIAGSAGQSVAVPERPGRRWPLLAAAGLVVMVGVGTLVAFSLSGRSSGDPTEPEAAGAGAHAADAAVAPAAMSALAVVTVPDGADVFVDGVHKGRAPLNLQVPVGATVDVRGELAGHTPASKSIRITAAPATARLDLAKSGAVDAAVTPPVPTTATSPPAIDRAKPRPDPRKPPRRKGAGDQSEQGFNPNDVL